MFQTTICKIDYKVTILGEIILIFTVDIDGEFYKISHTSHDNTVSNEDLISLSCGDKLILNKNENNIFYIVGCEKLIYRYGERNSLGDDIYMNFGEFTIDKQHRIFLKGLVHVEISKARFLRFINKGLSQYWNAATTPLLFYMLGVDRNHLVSVIFADESLKIMSRSQYHELESLISYIKFQHMTHETLFKLINAITFPYISSREISVITDKFMDKGLSDISLPPLPEPIGPDVYNLLIYLSEPTRPGKGLPPWYFK